MTRLAFIIPLVLLFTMIVLVDRDADNNRYIISRPPSPQPPIPYPHPLHTHITKNLCEFLTTVTLFA